MSAAYLIALLVSLGGVLALDLRFRLFLGRSPGRAVLTLAIGTGGLLIVDLIAIALGVFRAGDSPWMTGVLLAPHLPLEEPLFLLFLCELTMVLVAGTGRLGRGARASRGSTR